MGFADLADFFDPSLRLPIRGKTYVVPPLPAAAGLRFQALHNIAMARAARQPLSERDLALLDLDDEAEADLQRTALGGAWQEMVDDGLDWPTIQHAGTTAYVHWTQGRARAEEFWASPGKAPAPALSPPSTTTAGASTTRAPASTSGTRSPSSS